MDPVALLTTIRLPLNLETYGLPAAFQAGTTCLVEGDPGWAWDDGGSMLDIPTLETETGESVEGWGIDHVVVLVPDMQEAVGALEPALGSPRLRTTVEGRPTSFYRVGPLLEVIESPVRSPALFGIALVTDGSLEETAMEWRDRGILVTDPQPAIQPGREIFTVKGTQAGFAVMSPDGAR